MADVEIIYLRKNSNTQRNYKPKINVCKDKKVRHNSKNYKPIEKKPVKKKKKRSSRFYIGVFIAFILISAFLFTSHNAGYVPISAFLNIKSPSGSFSEIRYEELDQSYPITESLPEIKNIKHKVFETDETVEVVAENYKYDLLEEGYKLEYNGVKEVKGVDVHYYGYTKGITAVVILITSDNIGLINSGTIVLYSTGDVFSYKSIINRYSNVLDF